MPLLNIRLQWHTYGWSNRAATYMGWETEQQFKREFGARWVRTHCGHNQTLTRYPHNIKFIKFTIVNHPVCFLESRTLWWIPLDFYNQTLTRYPHNTIIQKQRSWVWAQGIKAEYSSRNTVFGAKKLGLSLNSFAVATRRWPTCDHHHHPLISAERQSINARLRELGVKRLALSAPCSLRSQPDGS